MATNAPVGNGRRQGAVKNRSQMSKPEGASGRSRIRRLVSASIKRRTRSSSRASGGNIDLAAFDRGMRAERDVRGSADRAMDFRGDIFDRVVEAEPEGEVSGVERRLAVAVVADHQQQPVVIENVAKSHDTDHPTRRAFALWINPTTGIF